MIDLIRSGVPRSDRVWADLGAGCGNFTYALRALLDPAATIYAIDRDERAVRSLGRRVRSDPTGAAIQPVHADFTAPLDLPVLDGVLIANALHFVGDQPAAIDRMMRLVRPGGRLLVVEYELDRSRPWVPVPLPFGRFGTLTVAAGLHNPTLVGQRRSPSTGVTLYAAVAIKPGEERGTRDLTHRS